MPTNVEEPQQLDSKSKASGAVPKLGARAVVELLKHNQPARMPPEFMVIENRKPDAINSLLQLLTRFQIQISKSPYVNASVLSLITKYLVEKKQCLFIAKPDIGAIHLIDSVFEKLLSSGKFDREAWCLLAQVRLPITKFALQDFSFFFAPQNMGRRLLNNITLNLLGTAEKDRKDQVRQAISQFIDKLNQNYRSHISEFNSVCIEMQSYFASQQQRLSKIETKISQIQKNQGKEDRSEPTIVEVLNREVGGRELPTLMIEFIYGEWRNSMRLVFRQDGENSPNWKRQVSLTQSMVQAYEACKTDEGRAQYTRFLPSMFKGIKGLLISVADDRAAFEKAFDPLELVLNAMVRGAIPDVTTAPMLQAKTVVNDSFEVIPVDEKYLEQIEQLTEGEWIRIKTPANQYEACKLSLKGKENEPWIFVNNTGSKIAKKNKYALAQGLRDGVVELVGKGQWIDDLLREAFTALAKQVEIAKQGEAEKQAQIALKQASEAAELPLPEVSEISEESAEPVEDAPQVEPGKQESISEPIALVSKEEQESSHHGADVDHVQRTDEILSNSTLSILAEPTEKDSQPAQADTSESDDWESYYRDEESYSEEEIQAAKSAVEALEVGALINLFKDGKEQRCKLAVKMTAKDKYIFVNPLGVKTWDTNSQEVIKAVIQGRVIIVDSGMKFDRALERVVMNIQADKSEQG